MDNVLKAILDALGGDHEAAEVAIDLAANEGRKNPKGFPAHLSGVLEGGYVERALHQRQQKEEAAERRAEEARIRERRGLYEQWCRDRAAARVAELDEASRRQIVDDRLPAYRHGYHFYLRARPWSGDEVRAWAEPRILQEYGREGEPSYDEWCRQAQPSALQNPTPSSVGSAVSGSSTAATTGANLGRTLRGATPLLFLGPNET